MRKVKYFISLLDVLVRRAILLIRSAANSLKLRLPLRYSLFPLLPQLSWGHIPGKSVPITGTQIKTGEIKTKKIKINEAKFIFNIVKLLERWAVEKAKKNRLRNGIKICRGIK
jgi:hypothetical protein